MIKSSLVGLLCGLCGTITVLFWLHAYNDHKALHAIIDMINANAAKQNGPPQHATP